MPCFETHSCFVASPDYPLSLIHIYSRRKVRRVHDEKRRVFEQALREAQSDAAAQQKLCDSAARELLVLIPAGDISRVSTYLDTALHKYAELDTLEREARELSLRCELLSAQQPQSDVPTEPAARPTRSRAELQSALDALTVRRREAQSTFDYTSGRCRAIGDAAELEAGLAPVSYTHLKQRLFRCAFAPRPPAFAVGQHPDLRNSAGLLFRLLVELYVALSRAV